MNNRSKGETAWTRLADFIFGKGGARSSPPNLATWRRLAMPLLLGVPTVPASASEKADLDSHLSAVVLSGGDAAKLRALAQRAAGADRAELTRLGRAAKASKLLVSLQPLPHGTKGEYLALSLNIGGASPAKVLSELGGLSTGERKILARIASSATAEKMFGWEDRQRAESDRGMKIGVLSALPLAHANADRLQSLVGEMRSNWLDGLAARARAVGYYREAMAMATAGKEPLFLLYLEVTDPDMRPRLRAYPDTDFTRWWNPQFHEVLGGGANIPATETLLDWESDREPH